MRNVSNKKVEKIKTRLSSIFFPLEIYDVCEKISKNTIEPERLQKI
jgi:hypothetical protein